jgi:hypothetical protein
MFFPEKGKNYGSGEILFFANILRIFPTGYENDLLSPPEGGHPKGNNPLTPFFLPFLPGFSLTFCVPSNHGDAHEAV